MENTISATPVPLFLDKNGVYRVAKTRVTLDSVVHAFNSGSTGEEIAIQFPVLDLSDIYLVMAYYLRNQKLVDEHLEKMKTEAERLKIKIQKQFPIVNLRQKLLRRKQNLVAA